MTNFTITDFLQTTFATLALALFLLPPGYVLAEASNIFGMRGRPTSEKLLFSVALSFAVTPILSVLLIRLFSYTVTFSVFLLLACVAVSMLARSLWRSPNLSFPLRYGTWQFLAALCALFFLVQLSLVDLQFGHRLYISYTAYDRSVRVPFVEAAARTGVPPLNPFYALGQIPPLRYFYYWYVVCALPVRLFGINAKACLNASVFWSGVGLFSIIPLFLKHVLEETENLRRKSLIGIALLAVTGLDLIPYMFLSLAPNAVARADLEWWDPNQVTSWMGSLLWVPHHVASLIACMAGLLLFSRIDDHNPLRQRIWLAVLAATAFASAAGLSVYVTFTFALFVVYWTLTALAGRNIKTFFTYVATGAITVLLSWPYLLELFPRNISASSSLEGTPRFAYFGLREAPAILDPLLRLHLRSPIMIELAKLPGLLVTYFIEFGFFAVVLFLCLRRDLASDKPLSKLRRMIWTMFAICLFAMTFLKSDSTGVNDLGFRGILVVQFVLLILAAPLLDDLLRRPHTSWARLSLLFTLVLGVAATAYQLAALRVYAPLADRGRITRDEDFLGARNFAERTYWLRDGFERLDRLTPPTAHVQYDPSREEVRLANLYSTRQAAMGDPSCESGFGGDLETCRSAFPSFFAVFNGAQVMRSRNLDDFCDKYQIDVLVANDVDPIWKDSKSWVWMRPTLVANQFFRAIPCGKASLSRLTK